MSYEDKGFNLTPDQALQELQRLYDAGQLDVKEVDGEITVIVKRPSSTARVRESRERRKAKGLPSRNPSTNRQYVIDRDDAMCVYCNSDTNLVIDHIIPIALGGDDSLDNLAVACRRCQAGKATRTPRQAGYTFRSPVAEQRYERMRERVTVTRNNDSRVTVTRDEPEESVTVTHPGIDTRVTVTRTAEIKGSEGAYNKRTHANAGPRADVGNSLRDGRDLTEDLIPTVKQELRSLSSLPQNDRSIESATKALVLREGARERERVQSLQKALHDKLIEYVSEVKKEGSLTKAEVRQINKWFEANKDTLTDALIEDAQLAVSKYSEGRPYDYFFVVLEQKMYRPNETREQRIARKSNGNGNNGNGAHNGNANLRFAKSPPKGYCFDKDQDGGWKKWGVDLTTGFWPFGCRTRSEAEAKNNEAERVFNAAHIANKAHQGRASPP